MKKFFGTKSKLALAILVILAVILISTASFAAGTYSKNVEASFTVIPLQPGVEIFSDAACTIPATTFDFGTTLHRGSVSPTVSMWIKNTGEVNYIAVWVTSTITTAQGVITYTPNSVPLVVGGVLKVDMVLTVGASATYAAVPLVLTINTQY